MTIEIWAILIGDWKYAFLNFKSCQCVIWNIFLQNYQLDNSIAAYNYAFFINSS